MTEQSEGRRNSVPATDYSHLIGPNTPPLFPTPWAARDDFVYDATGGTVATISTKTNSRDNAPDDRSEVARFIADAVNEKIERDAFPARIVFGTYRNDVEYFLTGVDGVLPSFYRIRPEGRFADAFYPDGLKEDWVRLGFVRDEKTPCGVLDVPEEFRL